jgi:hypothetical protein
LLLLPVLLHVLGGLLLILHPCASTACQQGNSIMEAAAAAGLVDDDKHVNVQGS